MNVVFDLDGTLADDSHRVPYLNSEPKEWDLYFEACDQDEPIKPMINTLSSLMLWGARCEIWTGRSASVAKKTRAWLAGQLPGQYHRIPIKMRPVGNYIPDYELKALWLAEFESRGESLDLVFEDRQRVVDMWREKGILCVQVRPGDF